ncbi:ribosome assembly RNA-binding protein YhbY [Mycoplasma sp. P36-A1]|uniref:ribosome assembly RNA-binding protein YhbY n=1 Tax=Mycoplasma sp. P36-A1 TaxID=3252900 RepID=UPI003C2C8733
MLNKELKKYLKAQAHHLKPIFQIGKNGIGTEMVEGIKIALDHRELIKVSILQNNSEDKKELAFDLARLSNAEVVQIIGKTIVLYKKNHKDPQFEK